MLRALGERGRHPRPGQQEDLYTNIGSLPPDQSELDGYLLSGSNDPHAGMTAELGEWILDRLPD
ncbi:hypothetical protein ACFXKG_12990 [Streptomyces sp. NPDC059255]|uniref:hypothetical protein n=1 Tax=Streptomyces sp. NPDC059255 TaxID=3346793 RepID=UPI0036BACDD2